jgi:hypothetical protein
VPHYVMDPVTERPVAVDGAAYTKQRKLARLKERGLEHQNATEAPPVEPEEKRKSWACPSPGCKKTFGSERGMQTHYGRAHKQEKANRSMTHKPGASTRGM